MLTHLTAQLAREQAEREANRESAEGRKGDGMIGDRESAKRRKGEVVEIRNVGPIERLAIPLPQAGVVVLRGRNGSGKSHALAAVDQLTAGRGRVPCRDGAARGAVEGFGARLTIGRSTRRVGEAEVATLEGRLDISQLVQPPVKEEEAADRVRIKALVQLSGASAAAEDFADILPQGVSLGQLVAPAEMSDDPVVLAGRVKRALESEARRAEKAAEEARGKAAALVEQSRAVFAQYAGAMPVVTARQAEQELQNALLAEKELRTRADEARKAAERSRKAAEAIESLKASAAAGDDTDALAAEECELNESIVKLEKALAVAAERRAQVRRRLADARNVRSQIEQFERIVAASAVEPVDDAAILAAAERVERARRQHTEALEAERAMGLVGEADRVRSEAMRCEGEAAVYRDAAAATDEVLSGLVGRVTARLRVEAGRLVCDTDRGVEPFGELSPGERWRIALEIAAEQVGRGGLVTIPQEAWEALDPINRAEVADIAAKVGVLILTAEASDDAKITPRVFAPANGTANGRE